MRFILISFTLALLVLSTTSIQAQTTAPKLVTTVEGIKEFELKNGLRVLLIPDNSETNIAVNIVYKVSSATKVMAKVAWRICLSICCSNNLENLPTLKKQLQIKVHQQMALHGMTELTIMKYYQHQMKTFAGQ